MNPDFTRAALTGSGSRAHISPRTGYTKPLAQRVLGHWGYLEAPKTSYWRAMGIMGWGLGRQRLGAPERAQHDIENKPLVGP
jgi:hypothetical protein